MRKITWIMIFVGCLFFLSCEASNKETTLSKEEALLFENIGKAPETDTKKPISEVAKIIFIESSFDTPYEPIVVNMESNEVYINPSISIHRFSSYDDTVKIKDVDKVRELLEKYDVQNWEKDYTFEDSDTYEDGYSWRLWLQFEDGTVEKHKGAGTSKKEITPENFEEFSTELRQLVNVSLGD